MSPPPSRRLSKYFGILGYTVFTFVASVALLELVSWAAWSAYYRVRPGPPKSAASPAYLGAAWTQEFWQEESLRSESRRTYVPFRVWSAKEWHGKYVNTDKTETGVWRRTINPLSNECEKQPREKIWIFGGSAVYGTGDPDWATLPSYLSRDLNAVQPGCAMVTNFGVEGYVTNQELILLMQQLKAGRRPDIVVFYDGFNDAAVGAEFLDTANAHESLTTIKARIEGCISGRLDFLRKSNAVRLVETFRLLWRPRLPPFLLEESHPKALATLDNYESNLQLAGVLGRAYNFKIFCFWQPMLVYGHKPLVPFEQRIADQDRTGSTSDSVWMLVITEIYQEAQRRAAKSADFVFLGDLFNSVEEPLYIDEVHVGPRGNELAAAAIAKYIEDRSEH